MDTGPAHGPTAMTFAPVRLNIDNYRGGIAAGQESGTNVPIEPNATAADIGDRNVADNVRDGTVVKDGLMISTSTMDPMIPNETYGATLHDSASRHITTDANGGGIAAGLGLRSSGRSCLCHS